MRLGYRITKMDQRRIAALVHDRAKSAVEAWALGRQLAAAKRRLYYAFTTGAITGWIAGLAFGVVANWLLL